MNFWWKLSIIAGIVTSIFTSGMYTEAKFHLAGQAKVISKEVVKAQEGQTEIVKFNTKIVKVYVKSKDECLNKPIPVDAISLLK